MDSTVPLSWEFIYKEVILSIDPRSHHEYFPMSARKCTVRQADPQSVEFDLGTDRYVRCLQGSHIPVLQNSKVAPKA
jgi:hypothetical protein